ncbi:MAG: beta-mannosidase [Fusobacteriales bacterium]|jgi:mannan endo-1,4-beta-mannosidase|nr:beta-mannosidase [Fusobacteriales bacterium]
MLNNAKTVFDSDILKNTVFSVHMYEVYNNYDKINNYISTFVNNKIPLIIGEFAAEHKGMDVKEYDILERCQSLGVGYLGWSWDGNSPQYGNIDIVNNWNPNSLTNWGNTLINSTNGIKNTSWKASVY